MAKTKRCLALVLALIALVSAISVAVPVFASGSANYPNSSWVDHNANGTKTTITAAHMDSIMYGIKSDYSGSGRWFVDGKPAVCCSPDLAPTGWSNTLSAGSYTKRYLKRSSPAAKAYYYFLAPLKTDGSDIDNNRGLLSGFWNECTAAVKAEAKAQFPNAANVSGQSAYYNNWRVVATALRSAGDTSYGNKDHLYVMGHFLIGYLFANDVPDKTTSAVNTAVKKLAKVVNKLPDVPNYIDIYFLDANEALGTSEYYQSFMTYEPNYFFEIKKKSSNTSITNGNSSYSMEGIRYYVSKSKTDFSTSGSNYMGFIELDKNGYGHSKDGSKYILREGLTPGVTYYVKEMYIPSSCKGYKQDTTVYPVKITTTHTINTPYVLNLSDTPYTVYFDIQKQSTNPEISVNIPEYSMQGIKYSVSKSKTDFSTSGSNYLGYIELDKNGYGHSKNGSRQTLRVLTPGTYYVKETYIPSGRLWKLSNTVYTVQVKFGHTSRQPLHLGVSDEPKARTANLTIVKESDNTAFTSGNNCYSLEGAEFKVYETKEDDFGKLVPDYTKQVGTTYITDEAGSIEVPSSVIQIGKKYAIEEVKAPNGYELYSDPSDESKHYIISDTLTELGCTVTFKEIPDGDPAHVRVTKRNAGEDDIIPGVVLTFTHFSDTNITTEEQANAAREAGKVTREWDFVTDNHGIINYDEEYLTDLYKENHPGWNDRNDSEDGIYYKSIVTPSGTVSTPAFPLGTIMIKEKSAPPVYELNPNAKFINITPEYIDDGGSEVFDNELTIEDEKVDMTTIEAEKSWDDDDNRDGVRPGKVIVTLYQDGEIFEDVEGGAVQELSADNGWYYSWGELPLKELKYNTTTGEYVESVSHTYEVKEEVVDGYYLTSTDVREIQDGNRWVFTNKHDVEYKPVMISKVWHNNSNVSGLQPDVIHVKLYQVTDDGETLLTEDAKGNPIGNNGVIALSKDDETPYQAVFTDLYKYYDGGKPYSYRVEELDVPDYCDVSISYSEVPIKTASGDGVNPDVYSPGIKCTVENTEKTGSATLLKTNTTGDPLPQVGFKLYYVSNNVAKAVNVSKNDTSGNYEFVGLANYDDAVELFTNEQGKISLDKLPFGTYFFLETTTAEGFIPFEDRIEFAISPEDPNYENVSVGLVNMKSILPETGGVGNYIFYGIGAVALIGVIVLVIIYYKKNKARKEK